MTASVRQVFVVLLLLCVAAGSAGAEGVPDSITYQGRLTDNSGQPVPDGSYQVQFKLYTVEIEGDAFWTSKVLNVQTSGGLFTTQLQPITPAKLAGETNVWLETLVGDPLAALAPRVKFASVPFALRAGELALPFSGEVYSNSDAFCVTNTGFGTAGYFRVNNTDAYDPALYARTNGTGDALYAYTTGTGNAVHGYTTGMPDGSAGYFEIENSDNFSPALYGATNGSGHAVLGFKTGGTGGNAGCFQIDNAANNSDALSAATNGGGDAVHGYTSGPTGSNGGSFEIDNGANTGPAAYAATNGSGSAVKGYANGNAYAGYFQISNTSNTKDALAGVTNGKGHAGYFAVTNSGTLTSALYAQTAGTSTYNAQAIHGVHSASGNYGYIGTGKYGVYGNASGSACHGVYGLASADNGYGVYGVASSIAPGASNYGVMGIAGGEFGFGGHFTAAGAMGRGIQAMAILTGDVENYGGYFTASGDRGIGIYARGGASGYAASFSGNVRLTDRTTGDTVMELGTGLDYAEGFDVADTGGVAPGAVLVIDAKNPGKLAMSRKPYDRGVAGIVAGAKNMGSGVRLGAGQFDRDVALAGRVYCNVDATNAGVQPGDLLTTSGTPGYAMKAANYRRAQGAILGKAMESLAKGRKGQILVLVSLQ